MIWGKAGTAIVRVGSGAVESKHRDSRTSGTRQKDRRCLPRQRGTDAIRSCRRVLRMDASSIRGELGKVVIASWDLSTVPRAAPGGELLIIERHHNQAVGSSRTSLDPRARHV